MGLFGSSKTEVQETALSKKQKEILDSRENFYQQFTQPELKDFFNQTKEFGLDNNYYNFTTSEFAESQVSGIRDAFSSQRDQLSNSLAQRGMAGSGIEAQSLAMLGAAEGKAVGNTVNQARLQSILNANQNVDRRNQNALSTQNVKQGGISSLLNMAPRPTTAAPVFQKKTGGGGLGGFGALLGGIGGLATGGADMGLFSKVGNAATGGN